MPTGMMPNSAYDVRKLPNPFVGLYSYTFNERTRFAGRDKALGEVVHRMTTLLQPLFFITGPTGAGKSSFANAALIPELEKSYTARHGMPFRAVMRPGTYPLSALAEVLAQIDGPPIPLPDLAIPDSLNQFLTKVTPSNQVNFILIDRFEELFTLSHHGQRELFLNALTQLAPIPQTHTHFIATFSSDFLAELDRYPQLAALARNGYSLPTLTFEELRQAITKPVEHVYNGAGKQFEPRLLDQLAADAQQKPDPLPWLQISLRQLWFSGFLTLQSYQPTLALDTYAENVLQLKEYAGGPTTGFKPRPAKEQTEIIQMVSCLLCPDTRQMAARPYLRVEIEQGIPTRKPLIDELLRAQILRVNVETGHELIELGHERLVVGWNRLNQLATELHHESDQVQRFHEALQLWLSSGRNDKYLLAAQPLKEAASLRRKRNFAAFSPYAEEFYQRSYRRSLALGWIVG